MNLKFNSLLEFWDRLWKRKLAIVSLGILICLFIVAAAAPIISPYPPNQTDMLATLEGPSGAHPLGTDGLGRDILSRIFYGARISLMVGFSAVLFATLIGIILGSVSGFYGGGIDTVIMRVMDMLFAFPAILLAMLLMSVLGQGLGTTILAIGIVSIPRFSRLVRGTVLSAREEEYVKAAQSIGCKDSRIMFRHILPNVMAPITVNTTMSISTAILYTSALGFLGLGVEPPQAEWGSMLAKGRTYIFNGPHVIYFPGLAIFITVLAFNLFGDGLRDAIDPKMKTKTGR